ncbi:ATP-dependent DNA helicase chl1 [Naganishia cerealis]|uniref:ATP-dependent DNA helicase chl1 n=1 Tax=Naganishia cerealis TaxID=610337 RepID=A0ACC2UVQ7_9TREE|nr:ATP-dependent DNA helicase chl1 [Naganishia cerealis]
MNRDDPRLTYNHPYKPYDIQVQLMDAIYDTIQNKYKVGLFESPTGTGKTLSIICSSMTWLRNYKKTQDHSTTGSNSSNDNDPNQTSDSDEEPDWVKEAHIKNIRLRTSGLAIDYERHLEELLQTPHAGHTVELGQRTHKRKKRATNDEDFLPDDYNSDTDLNSVETKNAKLQQEINQIMKRVDGSDGKTPGFVNTCPVTIFFSSRTHSQLSQFAHQLSITLFESSLGEIAERIKFMPLSSRKQLCIHPKVSSLSSVSAVNDACVELQQKSDKRCEFMPRVNNPESDQLVQRFADYSFAVIKDIEELHELGADLKVCPYYASRRNIENSEIIALPYQMLLQQATRKSLGLSIKDSIVIIDEAHNLLDVISSINSVSITRKELSSVIASLKLYYNKFTKRLNSGNRIHLMKLIKLCLLVETYIKNCEIQNKCVPGSDVLIDELFQGSTGDLLNIHRIEKYLDKSKIAYKIQTYIEQSREESDEKQASSPLLFKVTAFLKSLVNPSKEGRFFWDKINDDTEIKYLLLDPSEMFRDVVESARCVLLCGGTMEPVEDYYRYLFPYVPGEKIKKFTCGHIVPQENIEVLTVSLRKTTVFDFLYHKRNDPSMLRELALSLQDICERVTNGIIVFAPSYKYLNQLILTWRKDGNLAKISTLKQVFLELSDSTSIESILRDYGAAARGSGAILFSVVGGKMSEGVNFSDELARAVIMLGLPYPNAFSGELIAKRKFIEETTLLKGGTQAMAKENSREYYENICMRAVNQSVGRSIRHANDYSVIVLFDTRYNSSHIQLKLSGWMRLSIRPERESFDMTLERIADFFAAKTLTKR